MTTFKTKQLSNNIYIFCHIFILGKHVTIKMPVEYKIITAVIVGGKMMFYYSCDVDIEHKFAEFILTDNNNHAKLIKQCTKRIVAIVEILLDSKIYSLHEINKGLNFVL